MAGYAEHNNERVYMQDNSEITARFPGYEEKMELAHKGSPRYKKIFHILVFSGALYLVLVWVYY